MLRVRFNRPSSSNNNNNNDDDGDKGPLNAGIFLVFLSRSLFVLSRSHYLCCYVQFPNVFNDLRGELVGDKTKRQLIIFSHTQKSRAFVNIFYVCDCVYVCVCV